MFDLTSSKLLILALVALVVVGPKDLPVLLRTIGKYIGMIRRQATEFRSYFDEAMKEQELATLRAEMEAMKRDVQETVSSAGRALENDIATTKTGIEQTIHSNATIHSNTGLEPTPGLVADSTPAQSPASTEPPQPAAAEPAAKIGA